jgi:hypothetical protein
VVATQGTACSLKGFFPFLEGWMTKIRKRLHVIQKIIDDSRRKLIAAPHRLNDRDGT